MVQDSIPLETIRVAYWQCFLAIDGDVLLTSPVFSAIKARAPQAEIDALVYSDTAPMLSGHPAIAKVHGIGRHWKEARPFAPARRMGAAG